MNRLESIKWCCPSFHGSVAQAGQRGFAIFADNSTKPARFLLQHRALDAGAPMPVYDGHLSVITDTGLSFCPWCGKELEKWYENHLPQLDRQDLVVPLE
jgi:uncharacterized protein (DUF1684 family)